MKLLFLICLLIANATALSAPKPKKIFLAFDGTGNNARDFIPDHNTGKTFTNVLKLNLLAGGSIDNSRNDIDGQICLYKRGIGAESNNKIKATANQIKGELTQQTDPMMEMLEKVYEEGDTLYICGWSRGASAARKLVTIIDEQGLKDCKTGEVVSDPKIACLGCFDTVSAQLTKKLKSYVKASLRKTITKPSVLGEIDGKLSPLVEVAVHNIALDDNRAFRGTPVPYPCVHMDSADDRVHEAYFPGEHGDSGGNFYFKGIPDGSLQYMKEWFEKCGLEFLEKGEDIHPDCVKIDIEGYEDVIVDREAMNIAPDATDWTHWNDFQRNTPSYRPVIGVTNEEVISDATPRIHKSVLEHWESRLGKDIPYKINMELLHCKDVVIVGSLDEELPNETKRFKELLAEVKATVSTE